MLFVITKIYNEHHLLDEHLQKSYVWAAINGYHVQYIWTFTLIYISLSLLQLKELLKHDN